VIWLFMMQRKDIPILRDAPQLLLEVEQAVRHFPRYYKYTLGTEMRLQWLKTPHCLSISHSTRSKIMFKPTQTALLIGLLALFPLVGNAQTCQTASIPATTPTSQLTDNGNGTVTDTKTGLMWKQCSEGLTGADCATGSAEIYTWQAALAQAQTVNTSGGFAGHTDWRLPNVKELRSITEKQCYYPAINLTRFPNIGIYRFGYWSGMYWSASPRLR
jgi:hypothetical protein